MPTRPDPYEMKWPEMSQRALYGAISVLQHSFDPEAARNLIEYFHERMAIDAAYDQYALHLLVKHAFGKIIEEGRTADQAFGLKLCKGKHQRADTTERDVQITAHMLLSMRRGRTYLEARGDAANLLFPDGQGEKAAETAYAGHKETLSLLPDSILSQLAPSQLRS